MSPVFASGLSFKLKKELKISELKQIGIAVSTIALLALLYDWNQRLNRIKKLEQQLQNKENALKQESSLCSEIERTHLTQSLEKTSENGESSKYYSTVKSKGLDPTLTWGRKGLMLWLPYDYNPVLG